MQIETYCGFIAILGKSNVGKSTLLNKLLGKNISITADRTQTTRNNILGIKNLGAKQAIFIDTPGISINKVNKLNKLMNKAAKSAYKDVDLILFMIDSLSWDQDDEEVLRLIAKLKNPPKVWLLINKVDLLENQSLLLPKVQKLSARYSFAEIFPLAVSKNFNVNLLKQAIFNLLPLAPHYFPPNYNTDKDLNFIIAEIIREKLIKNLSQELPYITHVEILKIDQTKSLIKIYANIWVEKIGQKKIIIGKNGEKLKLIGTQARLGLEKFLDKKVFLNLFVRIKPAWTNDDLSLKHLNI